MLEFFDEEQVRELALKLDLDPVPEEPLDHTLNNLDDYWDLWVEGLEPHFETLKSRVKNNPYLSREERRDMDTIYSVKSILPYLKETVEFAQEIEKIDDLKDKLEYLGTYGNRNTRCKLSKDFAPYSFSFLMEIQKPKEKGWSPYFNGGLIYHGEHDGGGDGGRPSYSVNLEKKHGWTVHT